MEKIFIRATEGATLDGIIGGAIGTIIAGTMVVPAAAIGTLVGGGIGAAAGAAETAYDWANGVG